MNKDFYNRGHVLVMPFAHLSNKLEEPKQAVFMIKKFAEKIKEKGYKVSVGSFGTNKIWELEVYGHRGSVSYFEFPYDGKK